MPQDGSDDRRIATPDILSWRINDGRESLMRARPFRPEEMTGWRLAGAHDGRGGARSRGWGGGEMALNDGVED